MSSDIDSFVRECGTCTRFSKINKIAPLESVANKIENTWEVIGIDFTGPSEKLNGNILLTIIDYASRFPFAIKVKSTDAANTIRSLSNIFSIFGLPLIMVQPLEVASSLIFYVNLTLHITFLAHTILKEMVWLSVYMER